MKLQEIWALMIVDRYQPALSTFLSTQDELNILTEALATSNPWGWRPGGQKSVVIENIKNKIRNFHLQRHGERCCYCRVNLHGSGPFMIDREHILPKSMSEYKPYSYSIWNLGIACKRCNMEYKKTKIDFIVVPSDPALLMDSATYLFIHPNFDFYREHMSRSVQEGEDGVLVKYTVVPGSIKGAYTYDYFNLRGLEVNSLDEVQGAKTQEILGKVALEVRALADIALM